MRPRRLVAPLVIIVALLPSLARPRIARADVIPMDECSQKKEGEPCKTEAKKDGACGLRSYTATNHATNPPTTSSRNYIGCVEGATPTVNAAKRCALAFRTDFAAFDVSFFVVGGALLLRRRRRRRRASRTNA